MSTLSIHCYRQAPHVHACQLELGLPVLRMMRDAAMKICAEVAERNRGLVDELHTDPAHRSAPMAAMEAALSIRSALWHSWDEAALVELITRASVPQGEPARSVSGPADHGGGATIGQQAKAAEPAERSIPQTLEDYPSTPRSLLRVAEMIFNGLTIYIAMGDNDRVTVAGAGASVRGGAAKNAVHDSGALELYRAEMSEAEMSVLRAIRKWFARPFSMEEPVWSLQARVQSFFESTRDAAGLRVVIEKAKE